MLEELTAVEFGDLRTLLHAVLRAPELMEDPERTGVPVRAWPDEGGWFLVSSALVYGADHTEFCRVKEPARIFAVLKEHHLATEDDDDDSTISIDFADVRPLAELMPLPKPIDEEAPA